MRASKKIMMLHMFMDHFVHFKCMFRMKQNLDNLHFIDLFHAMLFVRRCRQKNQHRSKEVV